MTKKIETMEYPFYAVTETDSLARGVTFRKRGFHCKADALAAISAANKRERFKGLARTYLVTRTEIETGKVIL